MFKRFRNHLRARKSSDVAFKRACAQEYLTKHYSGLSKYNILKPIDELLDLEGSEMRAINILTYTLLKEKVVTAPQLRHSEKNIDKIVKNKEVAHITQQKKHDSCVNKIKQWCKNIKGNKHD